MTIQCINVIWLPTSKGKVKKKLNILGFPPKRTWKILKNARKRPPKKNWYIVPCLVVSLFPSFFQPFPMPYLISLKVPAFSQYSTCWYFYSIFVFVFKYLYTVLQGFWWRIPRARAFLLSWNQLILEEKRQRGTHCSQLRRGPQDSKKGTKRRPNFEQFGNLDQVKRGPNPQNIPLGTRGP